VLTPFWWQVASGESTARRDPRTSLRLGPAGTVCWTCCATAQDFLGLALGILVAGFQLVRICCGNPHFVAWLRKSYLIHLIFPPDWPKLRSAAGFVGGDVPVAGGLDHLPRFSASSRNGKKFTSGIVWGTASDGGAGPRSKDVDGGQRRRAVAGTKRGDCAVHRRQCGSVL